MMAILLVTWFYYGQPPATSQTQFSSMEACNVARVTILRDAARIREETDRQVQLERTRGVISNPIVPTVSAICAVQ